MSTTDTLFAGKLPALYDGFLGPKMFEPYAADLVARLRDVAHGAVLETAAGTGIVTRALAGALGPAVRIVATDLNPEMIELAAKHTSASTVTWKRADALALPFQDAEFDAVVCQFGVMFFPDKVAGFREASRVLKPGGRFVFSVWDRLERNEVSQLVNDAVARLFPDNPPRFYERIPFAYCDEARIRDDLRGANFRDVELEAVDKVTRWSSADAATGLCNGTPLRFEIEARRPGGLDEVTARVEEALTAHFGSASFENRMRAVVVTART